MKTLFLILAMLPLLAGCSGSLDGELVLTEPDSTSGFNYPYFLFIPSGVSEEAFIVVEPNNSGFVDDDLQKHLEKAKRTASKDFYLGNYVARDLKYPLVVPVFPREKKDWKTYTHSLDRDAMLQRNNSLERIDQQLIAMFEHARVQLKNRNIKTRDRFLLTGFSASGSFANRFTVLHPDRVFAVAAGGLNGILMLPLDSLDHEPLNYPIGTGDIKGLCDRDFQKDLFLNVPQFYFMGELDDNDAVPFDDAYDLNEREQIFRLLGQEMQPERWNNCTGIYASEGVNAIIKTYGNVGHEQPEIVKKEILDFFRGSIESASRAKI